MNTDGHRFKKKQLTERIIGCAYEVANELGPGFLEPAASSAEPKVYENALVHELRKAALGVKPQHALEVKYDGVVVGEYSADMIVEDSVIVEVKAVKRINDIHKAQCLNYLRATGLELCLLLNFGSPRVEIKRIILDRPSNA